MSDPAPAEPKKPFLVGYARVSMSDQNCQRQIDELIEFGVDSRDIWTDKASGKDMNRPGWQGLWRDIRAGDIVVILSLDRLGRDVLQILQTIEAMKQRGVELRVLTGGVDTTTPAGKRGVIGGRPPKMTGDQVAEAVRQVDAKEADVKTIAERLGVHKNSLQRRMERHRKLARMKGSENL